MIPSMSICINNRCNLTCTYCQKGLPGAICENPLPTRGLLSVEDLCRIVEIALDEGISVFRITGGEPFLTPIKVFAVMDVLSARGSSAQILINTNAALLRKSHLERLSNFPRMKLKVSLDSLEERRFAVICGQNSLKAVTTVIQEAVLRGIHVEVNCVVTRSNVHELSDLWDFCKDQGASLKLLDLYERDKEYWNAQYQPMRDIVSDLTLADFLCKTKCLSSGRGIPMLVPSAMRRG